MTVQECYTQLGGDYEDVKARFLNDEKIKRFLSLFLEDEHFDGLCQAMKEENYQLAFENVHTLKGVCANLSLNMLLEQAKELTELLRPGTGSAQAHESLARVTAAYEQTRKAIEQLQDE